MTDIDTGLNVWQMTSNHNRMIDLQEDKSPPQDGPVELAYFGSSAFRITSPRGVSVMIDPWRNHPSRRWDWYFHDFPSCRSISAPRRTPISTTTRCTGSTPMSCSTG